MRSNVLPVILPVSSCEPEKSGPTPEYEQGMLKDFESESDRQRCEVLQRLKILDTAEEQVYQDAVVLASEICGVPISLVSLVQDERQWFKAKLGIDATQTPRDVSFCSHAIQQSETFVVEDATRDPRFWSNSLVTSDFHLRFYAGAPIYADSIPVGTVCVLSKEPKRITGSQIRALEALARQVSANLELRLQNNMLEQREAQLAIALQAAQDLSVKLTDSGNFLRGICDAVPGLIAFLDTDLHFEFANITTLKWFGRNPEDLIGLHASELLGEELFALNEARLKEALSGNSQKFERTDTTPDGSSRHVLANYIPKLATDGSVQGIFVLVNDITELKETELQLRLAANVLDNIKDGVMVLNGRGIIIAVNPAFSAITGFQPAEVLGRFPRALSSDPLEPEFFGQVSDLLASEGHWSGEVWNRRKNGEAYVEQRVVTLVHDAARASSRYITVFRDVTAQWEQNQQMRHSALYDHLTDLPNRHLLLERLSQLLSQSHRENKLIALMFCDLDGFKGVNDSLGHAAGDAVLVAVSKRLQAEIRQTDTVARLGGDEFVVLLDNPANVGELEHIAERIIESVGMPIDLNGQSVQVGISVGIATNASAAETAEEFLECADLAMYSAKCSGKNGYRFLQISEVA